MAAEVALAPTSIRAHARDGGEVFFLFARPLPPFGGGGGGIM